MPAFLARGPSAEDFVADFVVDFVVDSAVDSAAASVAGMLQVVQLPAVTSARISMPTTTVLTKAALPLLP